MASVYLSRRCSALTCLLLGAQAAEPRYPHRSGCVLLPQRLPRSVFFRKLAPRGNPDRSK